MHTIDAGIVWHFACCVEKTKSHDTKLGSRSACPGIVERPGIESLNSSLRLMLVILNNTRNMRETMVVGTYCQLASKPSAPINVDGVSI